MTTPTHLNSLQRASRLGSLHEKTQETQHLQREAHNSHNRNTVLFHYKFQDCFIVPTGAIYTGFHILVISEDMFKILAYQW